MLFPRRAEWPTWKTKRRLAVRVEVDDASVEESAPSAMRKVSVAVKSPQAVEAVELSGQQDRFRLVGRPNFDGVATFDVGRNGVAIIAVELQ